ncbi:LysE/ArgO family amino acid transporter [Bacillus sp. S/N-304-OC-R1]|uniref:LysE/ArgO family amino acid transporter n=1 Tax=Bacillus sp. S/N-304-OC-R1 TaxID=2758034 RepID=UPI001C8EDDED|nr:LysE/ArgO family amino acid transporter [Bacillus sp. S/N-304-OC-R1]MBY0122255.1 amino acid transporter [Bacillus sp. S/N-304-OC-R1]
MTEAFLHGAILAFGLILPLGVQNVFVFNQGATQKHFGRALPAVITAGICDTLLILLAVTGVSIIVLSFEWIKNLMFIIGFFFLAYMGWSIWKSHPEVNNGQKDSTFSMKRQITFAASVSLLNPHAIMDTIGVIGTSSLAYAGNEKWAFTFACIGISWLWFLSLAVVGRKIGQFDSSGRFLRRMNQASAIIIWGMAIYIGIQVIK